MAGKPSNKDLIKLQDVPAVIFEMTGVQRKVDTVRKWAAKGVNSYDGGKVMLQTCRRLRGVYTTKVWIAEFLRKL
jgi:hypothetical protein